MKNDTFETAGISTEKGEPHFYNYPRFLDWCKQNKGKRFVVKIEVINDSSAKQYIYFKENILQQFIKGMQGQGYFMNEKEALIFIQQNCPYITESDNVDFYNMNKSRLYQVIEWLKVYMADSFDYYIIDKI